MTACQQVALGTDALDTLIAELSERGYRVIGPTLADGAIVYDDIAGTGDLPAGWTDDQGPGRYRVKPRDDGALFGYAQGPRSLKTYLHPPRLSLWSARRTGDGYRVAAGPQPERPFAFFGVRACDIQAVAIQDRVFLGGEHTDPHYRSRRAGAVMIAVNCGEPAATCFCASMGTGPRASSGFDIVLTELTGREPVTFVAEAGSTLGEELLARLPRREATPEETGEADALVGRAAAGMQRAIEADGLRDLLQHTADHPRWQQTAERCLTCGNCTMACPTCFCTTVEDVSSLSGDEAGRTRRWDSCFTPEFTQFHSGAVRQSPASRYRQWMTHKLSTWFDQFGTSGCVGCGRCITWCPVGIDITEEAREIRKPPARETP